MVYSQGRTSSYSQTNHHLDCQNSGYSWVLPHHFFAQPCIFPGCQALVACWYDHLLSQDCRWPAETIRFPPEDCWTTTTAAIRKDCKPVHLWKSGVESHLPPPRTVQRTWSMYHHQLKMCSTRYYQSQRKR